MQAITTVDGLKNAIQQLEEEQAYKLQILKEQFFITYESFKPVNLFFSTMKNISSSPHIVNTIVGSVMSLAVGYLFNKKEVSLPYNFFKKILGTFVQFGVTNVVAKHSDTIKSLGLSFIQHLFRKKEKNSEK